MPAFGGYVDDMFRSVGAMTKKGKAELALGSSASTKKLIKYGKRRVAAGAAVVPATMAMSNRKKTSGLGSYRPPMPQTKTPMGSGRFA